MRAVRQRQFLSDKIDADWTEQATRQVRASGGRQIEWYFHEQAAADHARELFDELTRSFRRIKIIVVPIRQVFLIRNPRINLMDRKGDDYQITGLEFTHAGVRAWTRRQ